MSSRWWSRLAAALGSIGGVDSPLLGGKGSRRGGMSSRFRRFVVIGASTALLVGLTAGSVAASASTKAYTLAVNPANVTYTSSTTPVQFSATYTNTTPTASINSLTLTAPAGFTISIPAGTPCSAIVTASSGSIGNCSVSSSTTSTGLSVITVTNLNPVNNGQTVTLTFTATVNPSGASCNDVLTWNSTAFTGSSLSGQAFVPATAPAMIVYSVDTSTTVSGVTLTNNGSSTQLAGVGMCAAQVSVRKPIGSTATLNFTVDIVWNPEPATYPLPPTTVDTPSPTHNIKWCGGTTSAPTLPSGEVSCLISESTQIAGSNTVQVHDTILLVGDWGAAR